MANINFQEHSLLFKKSWSQTLGKDVQFESMAYAIKVTHATSPSHTLLLPRPLKGAGITVLPRHVWPTFPEKKKRIQRFQQMTHLSYYLDIFLNNVPIATRTSQWSLGENIIFEPHR